MAKHNTLKTLIKEAIRETQQFSNASHEKHHRIIDIWIERDNRRKELMQTFKKSLVGIIALAIFSWLCSIGATVIGAFTEALK